MSYGNMGEGFVGGIKLAIIIGIALIVGAFLLGAWLF